MQDDLNLEIEEEFNQGLNDEYNIVDNEKYDEEYYNLQLKRIHEY